MGLDIIHTFDVSTPMENDPRPLMKCEWYEGAGVTRENVEVDMSLGYDTRNCQKIYGLIYKSHGVETKIALTETILNDILYLKMTLDTGRGFSLRKDVE